MGRVARAEATTIPNIKKLFAGSSLSSTTILGSIDHIFDFPSWSLDLPSLTIRLESKKFVSGTNSWSSSGTSAFWGTSHILRLDERINEIEGFTTFHAATFKVSNVKTTKFSTICQKVICYKILEIQACVEGKKMHQQYTLQHDVRRLLWWQRHTIVVRFQVSFVFKNFVLYLHFRPITLPNIWS